MLLSFFYSVFMIATIGLKSNGDICMKNAFIYCMQKWYSVIEYIVLLIHCAAVVMELVGFFLFGFEGKKLTSSSLMFPVHVINIFIINIPAV